MDKLQYFIGKICTIYTQPSNRIFTDQQHANSFCGVVSEVDEYGLWLEMLPDMKRKAFYTAHNLIGIVEEQVVPITDEQETEIKQAFAKEMASVQPPQQDDLISLDSIKNMAKNANKR